MDTPIRRESSASRYATGSPLSSTATSGAAASSGSTQPVPIERDVEGVQHSSFRHTGGAVPMTLVWLDLRKKKSTFYRCVKGMP